MIARLRTRIWKYKTVSALSLISLLLIAGGFFWAYGKLAGEPEWNGGAGPFILHFNDMQGITAVGGFSRLVGMGVLGVLIVLINTFVALSLEERDRALGKMVAGATLAIAILLFLAFSAILNAN